MWSQVRTSQSGHQMSNQPKLRLSLRSRIFAQPRSSALSCNCHRPRPPYGGWPYTSSIECLHTLTLLSMQRPKVAKQLHPPTPQCRAKGQTVEGLSSTNLEPTKREAAAAIPDTLFSPGDVAKAAHPLRHLSLFSRLTISKVGILCRLKVVTWYFTIILDPPVGRAARWHHLAV